MHHSEHLGPWGTRVFGALCLFVSIFWLIIGLKRSTRPVPYRNQAPASAGTYIVLALSSIGMGIFALIQPRTSTFNDRYAMIWAFTSLPALVACRLIDGLLFRLKARRAREIAANSADRAGSQAKATRFIIVPTSRRPPRRDE
jgi:hypothetical protein